MPVARRRQLRRQRPQVPGLRGGLTPRQIRLEISEDQNLDLNSGARQRLLALEQLSFTLAVDDDGTDYSDLQRHHTLPFDAV